jgi:hypothetical protein
LKSNLDTIILNAINRIDETKDKPVDSNGTAPATSYFDDGLLGLKQTLSGDGSSI